MATNTIPLPCPKSNLTRRAALQGTAACGALALPAALLAAAPAVAGTDPHSAWWAELQAIKDDLNREDDVGDDDPRQAREIELEDLISTTPPTTPEGMAVVATMIVVGHARDGIEFLDFEGRAADSLARYVLSTTPADVLARAGLEG